MNPAELLEIFPFVEDFFTLPIEQQYCVVGLLAIAAIPLSIGVYFGSKALYGYWKYKNSSEYLCAGFQNELDHVARE